MKQLYSAGPLTGPATVPGFPQPALKAASHGLRPEDVQAALPYTRYAPPPAGDPHGTRPLPVRLALLNTPAGGRMLTHTTPNGGTYFAHTLLNVPPTADAQLAIQTWGSPLWQRHEPDTAGELPELPYLPVADVLDDDAVRAWLREPGRRELLAFVLSALLATPPHARVFVAAAADDVAQAVYAVTRVLPPSLLDEFTFSTYEPDPLACQARLIGCDPGAADWDLPSACYDGAGVAYNPHTGRKSDLKAEVPFAAFAVESLASGDTAKLDEFRAAWQRLGLSDPRQFDLVFRLARGAEYLAKDESAAAVQHPTLAAWVSVRPDAVKRFLEWALDDTDFAHRALSRVLVPLRQKADAVAKLAEAVRQAGFTALATGDRARTANALEVILPMAAPAKANAVWADVLARVPDPAGVSWEMRWYLLPRLVRSKHPAAPATATDRALTAWLDVPADRLGELLALDLPKAYHLAAARSCLAAGEPTPAFARAVAAHPALAVPLLQPHDGITENRAVKLFETLLAEAPGHPWFEGVLAHAAAFPADRRNRFFEAALATGKADADRLVRTHGAALLELFAGQSGLDRLGRQFLAAPAADVFTCSALLDFLVRLENEPQIGDDVKQRAAAVRAVRRFLDRPEFAPEALRPVAAALTIEPPVLPPAARDRVLAAVHDELTLRAHSPEFQHELEAAIVHLGGPLADGPAGLYRELLRRQRQRRDFGRDTNAVHAFLAVALGAAHSADAAKQADGLEPEAFAVAAEAARKGGRRALAAIDARTADWPKAARAQWGFLREAVRPNGLGRAARDCLLFAAGAATASGAWFVVTQVVR